MGLYFRNSTYNTLYISYAYVNYNCSPVNYAKIGWYRVDPGQTRLVWNGYAGGQTFYYYAEDAYGRVWNGPYYTQVPNYSYHWCWNTGCTSCRNLGFRALPISSIYADYTLNFVTTSSSQAKSKSENMLLAFPSKVKDFKPKVLRLPVTVSAKMKKGKPVLSDRISLPKKRKRKK